MRAARLFLVDMPAGTRAELQGACYGLLDELRAIDAREREAN